MTQEQETELLASKTLRELLVGLRKTLPSPTCASVAEMLEPHCGPRTRQAIRQYEQAARGLHSDVQLAYALAFNLPDPLRLHLQQLAGESVLKA